MFSVKHAIMEILSKSKSLDEALSTLDSDEQDTLIKAFDLIKTKLGGTVDVMDAQDNGQWSLNKAISSGPTIDYSTQVNPRKTKEQYAEMDAKAPTINYANITSKPKAGSGAVARRDAARAKIDAANAPAKKPDAAPATGALAEIKARQDANKSEDIDKSEDDDIKVKEMKAKYSEKKPKLMSEKVADVKDKLSPKPLKTDAENVAAVKEKYS